MPVADFDTLIHFSQAISGEVEREKLVDKLMRVAIEHARAQRGLLVLSDVMEPRILAEAWATGDAVRVRPCNESLSATALPEAGLHYAWHTGVPVIVNDAHADPVYADDPYVVEHRARSMVFIPLIAQTKLVGVLYLESNRAHAVFVPNRIAMLNLLASQAAATLENVRLYRELATRDAKIQTLVDAHEHRLLEMQAALAHAGRVATMGQLTASISHEIRQPIASIATCASAGLRWLNARPPNVDEIGRILDRIVHDAMRADSIMSRIHHFIKKAPIRIEWLQMNDVIREVTSLTRGEARKLRVTVHVQLQETLPAIRGDRVQLQQVLMNLIVNALDEMSNVDGERTLMIRSWQAKPDSIVVSVRDSGRGVCPELVGRIFEPFYTTKTAGLGMGLSICRAIVEAHHGQLQVTARLPSGSTFEFDLPIHDITGP